MIDRSFIQLVAFSRLRVRPGIERGQLETYVAAMLEGDAKTAAQCVLEGQADLEPKLRDLLVDAAIVAGVRVQP